MSDALRARSGVPKLLVSVRDAAEAKAAVLGGAEIIDVKEPTRGALGPADPEIVRTVATTVGHGIPVTAAAGELGDLHPERVGDLAGVPGVQILKIGVTGASQSDWLSAMVQWRERCEGLVEIAPTLYADHASARSPDPRLATSEVLDLGFRWIVLDTFNKQGGALFDHLSVQETDRIVRQAQDRGARVTLAGGLESRALERAAALRPDIVGVRGAACGGDRRQQIRREYVAQTRTRLRCCGDSQPVSISQSSAPQLGAQ